MEVDKYLTALLCSTLDTDGFPLDDNKGLEDDCAMASQLIIDNKGV